MFTTTVWLHPYCMCVYACFDPSNCVLCAPTTTDILQQIITYHLLRNYHWSWLAARRVACGKRYAYHRRVVHCCLEPLRIEVVKHPHLQRENEGAAPDFIDIGFYGHRLPGLRRSNRIQSDPSRAYLVRVRQDRRQHDTLGTERAGFYST